MSLNRNSEDDKLQSMLALIKLEGYELIKFDGHELDNEMYRWIAIKRDHLLGRGSYGNVYKAYPVNPVNGELIKSKKLAVKIYKDTKQINANEAKFFDAYYPGCEIITTNEDIYMVMACLPGKSIMQGSRRGAMLNVEINQFDFNQRVDLIYNIMLAINIMHHKTVSTGNALIHGDINGSNIIVNYADETGKIDVYIVDFGLAEEIEDQPNLVKPTEMIGTPLFMPCELYSEQDKEVHGVKSDIYALTPIFAAILGATNPFENKIKWNIWERKYFEAPYNFSGIFTGYEMHDGLRFTKDFILKFLSRMQNLSIHERPDSDETLRFFTTLNKLCKTMVVDDKHIDIPMCGAMLAAMADGAWIDSEVDKDGKSMSENDTDAIHDVPAPEHFDFEGAEKTATCVSIMRVAKKTPLNTPLMKRIMSKENGMLTRQKSTIFVKINNAVQVNEQAVQENGAENLDVVLKLV